MIENGRSPKLLQATDNYLDRPHNPYPGLRSFQAADAPYFYTDPALTQRLVTAVQTQPFTALIGASGSGKSSLLLAGVLPHLRKNKGQQIIVLSPGEDPYLNLAVSLIQHVPELLKINSLPLASASLATFWHSGQADLLDVIDPIATSSAQPLLIVIDQFEELYTRCSDSVTRYRFLTQLLRMIQLLPTEAVDTCFPSSGKLPVLREGKHNSTRLLISLQAEFLGQALGWQPLADLLQDNDIKLGSLSQIELQRAIGQPAAQAGVAFEPGLVEQIVEDVTAVANLEAPNRLAYLQLTLAALWQGRENGIITRAVYRDIGGINALPRYVQQTIAELTEVEHVRLKRILTRLVIVEKESGTRHQPIKRSSLDELEWEIVQKLIRAGLMRSSYNAIGQKNLELAHQSLIYLLQPADSFQPPERPAPETPVMPHLLPTPSNKLSKRRKQSSVQEQIMRVGTIVSLLTLLVVLGVSARNTQFGNNVITTLSNIDGMPAMFDAVIGAADSDDSLAARTAHARELAALSTAVYLQEPQTSLLQAIQAVNATYLIDGNVTDAARTALYQALTLPQREGILFGHQDWVTSVTYNGAGTQIITASGDGTVRLWQADGTPVALLRGHTDWVSSAVFSPDDSRIISAGADGNMWIWDVQGQPIGVVRGHTKGVNSAVFSPDGHTLLSASDDYTARLWDEEGALIAILEGHTGPVMTAVFSPDGERVLTASGDGTARLWGLDGQLLATLNGHSDWVNTAVFNAAGTQIATASSDGDIRLWTVDGSPITTLSGHTDKVWSLQFNEDGTRLVSASSDATARLWDVENRPASERQIGVLEGHDGWVRQAVFAGSGSQVVTIGGGGMIRLWDGNGRFLRTLGSHSHNEQPAGLLNVALHPDRAQIVTASQDGTARIWQIADISVGAFAQYPGWVAAAEFNQNGTEIVVGGSTGTTQILKVDGGNIQTSLDGHAAAVQVVAYNQAQTRILTAGRDGTARLWRADGGLVAILKGHSGPINTAQFNSLDTAILTSSDDGTARLWSREGEPLITLAGHAAQVTSATFNLDGSQIVTASYDGTVRLWNLDGQVQAVLSGHTGAILSAMFNQDGSRILTASQDGTARIWGASGEFLFLLEGHNEALNAAVFNQSGSHILTASQDGTTRLWDADGVLITVLDGHTSGVQVAIFSMDDQHIVTASQDGSAQLWDGYGRFISVLTAYEAGGIETAVFNQSSTAILTGSQAGNLHLWPVYPSTDDLLAAAKHRVALLLTAEECLDWFFPEECAIIMLSRSVID